MIIIYYYYLMLFSNHIALVLFRTAPYIVQTFMSTDKVLF